MSLFNEPREQAIFEIGVDETAKAYLLETVRWTRFMAILTIVLSLILLLIGGYSFYQTMARIGGMQDFAAAYSTGMVLAFLIAFGLYVYPIICLFRFSSLMKGAMMSSNTAKFNEALRYQRNMWRYTGILMIIAVAFYGIVFAVALIGIA